jgi:broad-specificity NMP kinase
MSYDFSQLNDKEFESLSTDLLSIYFNTRIERFKTGKDQGVDGRFFSASNKEIILQYKHYIKSGYSLLISKLKTHEAEKVKKINPEKYLFVTSLPLSRDNKKDISNIFAPFIKNDNDIYGQEDLNDLLSQYPKIEEKHFKLWISSSNVLNRLINSAIKGRSEYEIEQIEKKSKIYAPTFDHYRALKILEINNAIIISGEPGIGKTTLAENLCLYFVSKGYEFLTIEESLSEAENVYKKGEKQIFYFDDFLGSNYFEAIENKKDSHIMKFIERVHNDKTKLFILTSRTNILNAGVLYSNVFSNNKIQKNEFLLTIDRISELDRAKILYNHIWFSELSEEYIDEIYTEKRYRKIISHKNFNPRLINFITDVERVKVKSNEYWKYIESMLNNPEDIWNNIFNIQSNSFVRNLVLLTVFNGNRIPEDDLRKSYYRLNDLEGLNNPTNTEKDFNSIVQLATKSFLNREKSNSIVIYSLFNPSIADFIISKYKNDIKKMCTIYKSLFLVNSIDQLISLKNGEIITTSVYAIILDEIFEDAIKQNKNIDYLIYLSYLLCNDEFKINSIVQVLKNIINEKMSLNDYSKLFYLLCKYNERLHEVDVSIILKDIDIKYLKKDELINLLQLMNVYKIDNEEILDEVKEGIWSYLMDIIDDLKNDIDMPLYLSHDEYGQTTFDEERIKNKISEGLDSIVSEFNSDIFNKLHIDLYEICSDIDVEKMYWEYMDSPPFEHPDYTSNTIKIVSNNIDPIDDLFEKT